MRQQNSLLGQEAPVMVLQRTRVSLLNFRLGGATFGPLCLILVAKQPHHGGDSPFGGLVPMCLETSINTKCKGSSCHVTPIFETFAEVL